MSASTQTTEDVRFSLHLGVAVALSYVSALVALVGYLLGGW